MFRILFLCMAICPSACTFSQQDMPACEWCGAGEAPSNVSWQTTIPGKNEPGEWITIRGRVFERDGETPAEGVILYVYHTNAKGIYEKKGNETGNGKRHGYLRGWMRTNAKGEYQFTTIKPAPYPGGMEPAHIHLVVMKKNEGEYTLESYHFDDDEVLTEVRRSEIVKRDEGGILKLKSDGKGMLEGTRDIYLTR